MEAMVVQWRDYKDEYERLSDWLQQMDILVKAQKNALLATVQEKQKQVQDVKVSWVTVFSWSKSNLYILLFAKTLVQKKLGLLSFSYISFTVLNKAISITRL